MAIAHSHNGTPNTARMAQIMYTVTGPERARNIPTG